MQQYIDQLNYYRRITNLYLTQLSEKEWYHNFDMDDMPLNNIAWIVGHITVSENFLCNYTLGLPHLKIPWARSFGLGSFNAVKGEGPSQVELLVAFNEVHENTVKNWATFDSKKLNEPNSAQFQPPNATQILTNGECIFHGMWHECYHGAQLAQQVKWHNVLPTN